MNWIAWVLSATTIILLIIAIFLGKEMLKKFKIITLFSNENGYIQTLKYSWPGSPKKGMRKIALKSDQPFEVIIGFKLRIPLLKLSAIDYFGYIMAEERNQRGYHAVFSTFMWKTKVDFVFLVKSEGPQEVELVPKDQAQAYVPDIVCNPHLYQRLGFH